MPYVVVTAIHIFVRLKVLSKVSTLNALISGVGGLVYVKVEISFFILYVATPTSFPKIPILHSPSSKNCNSPLRPQASNWDPNSVNELLVLGSRMMLMSMLGYFLSDLVAIVPEWRKHKVTRIVFLCKMGYMSTGHMRV